MLKYLIIFFIVISIYKLKRAKIHIDFKSLFKFGFKKNDNLFGLYCYVGKQGKGKTYSAVKFVLDRARLNNYKIVTNIKSFSERKKCIYIDDIHKLIRFVNANYKNNKYIILFDEIFTILEKNTPLNKEILAFLSQLRKKNIIFVTTAQEWFEINKTFRRYVRFEIDCNMFSIPIIHTAFLYNKINDGEDLHFDERVQDLVGTRVASNFSKANREIINSYDTFEVINVT